MTQDQLDQFTIKGFGIVVKMLNARLARTQQGLSNKRMEDLTGYTAELIQIRTKFANRPAEKSMFQAESEEKLDEAFITAFHTLVEYFERRKDKLTDRGAFEQTVRRFQKCLLDS